MADLPPPMTITFFPLACLRSLKVQECKISLQNREAKTGGEEWNIAVAAPPTRSTNQVRVKTFPVFSDRILGLDRSSWLQSLSLCRFCNFRNNDEKKGESRNRIKAYLEKIIRCCIIFVVLICFPIEVHQHFLFHLVFQLKFWIQVAPETFEIHVLLAYAEANHTFQWQPPRSQRSPSCCPRHWCRLDRP